MTLPDVPPAAEVASAPEYCYPARVEGVIDGDTFDVAIDPGFDAVFRERLRLRDIDTRETHFVSNDTEEYERGKAHERFASEWIGEARQATDGDWPLMLYSEEFDRGTHCRVIGDLLCPDRGEWLTRALDAEFDDVRYYP